MGNQPNKIENIGSIANRGVGLTATADVFDALAAIPKDMRDIVKYTSGEIKNIFKSATTKGKRYQRIGNTILSPFVAIGAAVEGALRTVVTPSVNFVKNAINSTFGSVFSKKPISNFKYEELKTTNVIEKNENWFSKWRLSRKIFQDKKGENKDIRPNQPSNAEQKKGVKDTESNKEVKSDKTKKDNKNVKDNKDSKNNKDTKNDNDMPQNNSNTGATKEQENKQDSSKEIEKAETGEKASETTKEPTETVEKNMEHIGVEEAKKILDDSPCGKIIIDGLCAHKDFGIIFKDNTSMGRCNEDHTITIGTEIPNGIAELAPFNRKTKDSKFQKKHLLLHELSHCAIHSHKDEIPGINKGLDLIKRYIETNKNIGGRTLSLLSYGSSIYPTSREKAREDFVEMLALRMNGNGNLCKKYLKLLSDDEHRSFRENHGLATITKEDASKLQNIFDSIIRYYENLSN